MKLVIVRWFDAMSDDSGWKKLGKVKRLKPPVITSVGYLARHTKKKVTLVASVHGKDVDGDVVIPRGMVKSIRLLEEGKKL